MNRSVSSTTASIAAQLRPSAGVNSGGMTSAFASKAYQSSRWRPGLSQADQHPCHNEVFANSEEGAGAALALALARDAVKVDSKGALADADDQRCILWVQTADAIKRGGRPYIHGLPPELSRRLIHVAAENAQDALFALEEGVRCRDFAFVIGEVRGNPRALDFTASRRLTLTAQSHGSRLYLIRLDARPDLSSARMRWNAASAPSQRSRWNADAPGVPSWKAELFRARSHPPGNWILHDHKGNISISRPKIPIPEAANAPDISSIILSTGPYQNTAAHYGDMGRATVGRSLAAL
ncbi:MAG: hypothetical protein ABJP34_10330 [Erythrobacter sp.]